MRCLRGVGMEAGSVVAQSERSDMQQDMQRLVTRSGMERACRQRPSGLESGFGEGEHSPHDGGDKPGLEGRCDAAQSEGGVCGSGNKVCEVSAGVFEHGASGRVCHGASSDSGAAYGAPSNASGSGSSYKSRCNGQSPAESDGFRHERDSQGVRAWRGHTSAMVRVEPFYYRGKVWCLRVPTGAFVAVRNGIAFPTGNSGFPKSHNGPWGGTALKPALEPITMARKPLTGTLARNWREHGTGALNIDGCRVGDGSDRSSGGAPIKNPAGSQSIGGGWANNRSRATGGRWPANLIHDGCNEVVAGFPTTGPSSGADRGASDNGVSAARFFYCAKASRKDRNEGCNEVVTWESVDLNPVTGAFNELRRAMCAATTQRPEGIEWSTLWYGSRITAPCQTAIRYIIEMASRTTTESKTSNCSPLWSTSASIRAAIAIAAEHGSSLAELAESTSQWSRDSTDDAMASVRHAAHAVLHALSETSKLGKLGNTHSTVKPTDLMRYLCRLVTPPGGRVLDPFMGSGSTGKAALLEGYRFIGIERDDAYFAIAKTRVAAEAEPA